MKKDLSITITNILVKIFGGVELAILKSFFIDIINSSVDTVIFTTRRSHLLYYLFSEYVLGRSKKENVEKSYITDKSICFNKEKIKQKTVLVVDDIVVHGRALENVIERIVQLQPKIVRQYVYAQSDYSSIDSSEKYSNVYQIKSKRGKLDNKEWKQLSNQIVSALILTSIPYASNVFSFVKSMSFDNFLELKKTMDDTPELLKLGKIPLSLNENNNNSKISDLIEKNIKADIYGISNSNSSYSFLRIYYNKLTQKCILIPFSIIGEYSRDEINELCQSFKEERIDNSCLEAKYRVLTAYYSLQIVKNNNYTESFFNEDNWEVTVDNTELSYYRGFYNCLLNTQCDMLINNYHEEIKQKFHLIEKPVIPQYDFYDVYLQEFQNLMFEQDNKLQNLANANFWHTFLKNVNRQDEKNIEECEEKHQKPSFQSGLSFAVFHFFKEKHELFSEAMKTYAEVLNLADTGLLSLTINNFKCDSETYYTNYIITGEQVCRLYQNEIYIFLLKLDKIIDNANRLSGKKLTIKDLIGDIIENYISDENLKSNIIKQIPEYNKDPFVLKNIYEHVYNKELKIILENVSI